MDATMIDETGVKSKVNNKAIQEKANGLFPTTKARQRLFNDYDLHFCNTCKGFFDVSFFTKNKGMLFGIDAQCNPCKKLTARIRNSDGFYTTSYKKTYTTFPKPNRIKSAIKSIKVLRNEFEKHKNPTMTIALKDPRTVQKYYEQLAKVKLASIDLKWVMDYLQKALHGGNDD